MSPPANPIADATAPREPGRSGSETWSRKIAMSDLILNAGGLFSYDAINKRSL